MKLVEIISTPQTSPETSQQLFDLCSQMGKSPVTCKDTPGFIVSPSLSDHLVSRARDVLMRRSYLVMIVLGPGESTASAVHA